MQFENRGGLHRQESWQFYGWMTRKEHGIHNWYSVRDLGYCLVLELPIVLSSCHVARTTDYDISSFILSIFQESLCYLDELVSCQGDHISTRWVSKYKKNAVAMPKLRA